MVFFDDTGGGIDVDVITRRPLDLRQQWMKEIIEEATTSFAPSTNKNFLAVAHHKGAVPKSMSLHTIDKHSVDEQAYHTVDEMVDMPLERLNSLFHSHLPDLVEPCMTNMQLHMMTTPDVLHMWSIQLTQGPRKVVTWLMALTQ